MDRGLAARRAAVEVSTAIRPALEKRLRATAKGTGADVSDILRIGAIRVIDEFEATGSITAPTPLPYRGLRVEEKHAKVIRWLAGIIDMDVEVLFGWILDDYCADLSNRDMGLADGWVNGTTYPGKKGERAAQARLKAWVDGGPQELKDAPGCDGLMVAGDQSRALSDLARMIEVPPGLFLRWLMEYELENLTDPLSGNMHQWVHELLKYDSPEEEKRVKERFAAWDKQARAASGRKAVAK